MSVEKKGMEPVSCGYDRFGQEEKIYKTDCLTLNVTEHFVLLSTVREKMLISHIVMRFCKDSCVSPLSFSHAKGKVQKDFV